MPDDAVHPSAPGADPATRRDLGLSLWIDLDRTAWRALRAATPNPLSDSDLATLRGLSDDLDVAEVTDVYLPLSRLLNLYVAAEQSLDMAQRTFLGTGSVKVPYVIAVAGSVAVGKSTTARLLQALLARWPDHPRVELVTTDGFLLPNAVLAERGLMARKGFPESYDRAAVVRFLDAVKSGREEINVPVYSHLTYDVVKGATKTIRRPDILVLEGLNLLQTVRQDDGPSSRVYPSDYFDFSIYVDAREDDIRRWYVSRFLRLRETAFRDDKSYFRRFADLSESEAIETALSIWDEINGPNLVDNIAPTRSRARLVLEKGADHKVQRVRLRKT